MKYKKKGDYIYLFDDGDQKVATYSYRTDGFWGVRRYFETLEKIRRELDEFKNKKKMV